MKVILLLESQEGLELNTERRGDIFLSPKLKCDVVIQYFFSFLDNLALLSKKYYLSFRFSHVHNVARRSLSHLSLN